MKTPETERETFMSRIDVPLLSVVVPCFNEQEVIETTYHRLDSALGALSEITLEMVFVDDGSTDSTFLILDSLRDRDSRVRVVRLSRNFGHQIALTAGLEHASGNIVAIIDADLQDPPEVILDMIEEWRKGYDVVYGIRTKRKESTFKRAAYAVFYRMLRKISEIDMPLDSGDFCLMDRHVVDKLNALPERSRFLRGLRAWLGFSQKGIEYERTPRAAGKPKYTFFKLVALATDGLINFSIRPLSYIAVLGLFTAFLAVLGACFYLYMWFAELELFGYTSRDFPGFTTLILAILFFSGIQLFSIGIIGQYIGRTYMEVKGRPLYVVRELLGFDDDHDNKTKAG